MKKTTLLLTMVLALCGSAMAGASAAFPLVQGTNQACGPEIMPGVFAGTYSYDGTTLDASCAYYPSVPACFPTFTPDAAYADDYILSATITFDQTLKSELGLMARNAATGNTYEFSLNPNNGYLVIARLDAWQPDNLADFQYASLDITKSYKLEFSVEGDQLNGYLYDDQGTLIQQLSATDSTYTTGAAGAYVYAPSGATGVHGTFTNPMIGEIPEPATLSLLAVGGVLALIRRRK